MKARYYRIVPLLNNSFHFGLQIYASDLLSQNKQVGSLIICVFVQRNLSTWPLSGDTVSSWCWNVAPGNGGDVLSRYSGPRTRHFEDCPFQSWLTGRCDWAGPAGFSLLVRFSHTVFYAYLLCQGETYSFYQILLLVRVKSREHLCNSSSEKVV